MGKKRNGVRESKKEVLSYEFLHHDVGSGTTIRNNSHLAVQGLQSQEIHI